MSRLVCFGTQVYPSRARRVRTPLNLHRSPRSRTQALSTNIGMNQASRLLVALSARGVSLRSCCRCTCTYQDLTTNAPRFLSGLVAETRFTAARPCLHSTVVSGHSPQHPEDSNADTPGSASDCLPLPSSLFHSSPLVRYNAAPPVLHPQCSCSWPSNGRPFRPQQPRRMYARRPPAAPSPLSCAIRVVAHSALHTPACLHAPANQSAASVTPHIAIPHPPSPPTTPLCPVCACGSTTLSASVQHPCYNNI